MLKDAFNNFMQYAKLLKAETGIQYDAKPYKETIRQMLDGFCKAMDEGDEHLKSLYCAGLILRHWDKVKKLIAGCPNIGLEDEDFVGWVYEAIMLACEYRKWQKDETVNAQQCINQCIETIRVRKYYEFNLDKHRANYNTISISQTVGEEGNSQNLKTLEDTLSDTDEEEKTRMADSNSTVQNIIQACINKSRLVEAIILDIIAFGDTIKITKKIKKGVDSDGNNYKYSSYSREFWKFKAIQILSNLPDDYAIHFLEKYAVNTNALDAALDVLKRANNSKLYRELDKSIQFAKTALGLRA